MAQPRPSELPDDVFNKYLEEAMKSKDSKLSLSDQEQQNLTIAMKKPEFTKLLKEYMDEISDPKNRAEQEAYLQQLERENKVPQHVRLIHPKAAFCVKVKRRDSPDAPEGKLFINICTAEEIGRPEPTRSEKGVHWSLPYSLGPMRHELDRSREAHPTFDFALNPDTCRRCKDARFQKMVIDTALDAVESRVKEVLKDNVKLVRGSARVLKGVPCIGGKPAIMQIGAKGQGKANEAPASSSVASSTSAATTQAGPTDPKPRIKEVASSTSAPLPPPANQPKYTLVHRGLVDLADFVESTTVRDRQRPKELVIRVQVPKIKSARFLDIETAETSFRLRTMAESPAVYELNLDLPFPVNEEEGKAKFDKAKRVLEVTLPVKVSPTYTSQNAPAGNAEPESVSDAQSKPGRGKLVEELPSQPDRDLIKEPETLERPAASPGGSDVEPAPETPETQETPGPDQVGGAGGHSRWVSSTDKPDKTHETDKEHQQAPGAGEVMEPTAPAASGDGAASKASGSSLEQMLAQVREAAKLPLPRAEDFTASDARAVEATAAGAADGEISSAADQPESSQEVGAVQLKPLDDNSAEVATSGEVCFEPCAQFSGKRNGFVFKLGNQGLGYYKDASVLHQSPSPPDASRREEDQRGEELAAPVSKQPHRLSLRSREIFDLD